MKRFLYNLTFSPYMNMVRAKNRKDAWRQIVKLWTGAGYSRWQVSKMAKLL